MGWWVSCRVDLMLLSLAHSSCFSAGYVKKNHLFLLSPRSFFLLFHHPPLSANLSLPSPSLWSAYLSFSSYYYTSISLSPFRHPCVPLFSQVRKGSTAGPTPYGSQHLSGSTEMGRYMVGSYMWQFGIFDWYSDLLTLCVDRLCSVHLGSWD